MKPLSLARPHIIVMLGIAGSGKTFFAEQFANTFHTPYIHYEKMTELAGISNTAVHRLAAYQLGELLKTKQSIIIEGIAQSRADRQTLVKKANTLGYEVLFVWVQTDPAAAMQRTLRSLTNDTKRATTGEQYERQAASFVMPQSSDNVAVISGKHTFASQTKAVLHKLSASRSTTTVAARTRKNLPTRDTASASTAKAKGRRTVTIK